MTRLPLSLLCLACFAACTGRSSTTSPASTGYSSGSSAAGSGIGDAQIPMAEASIPGAPTPEASAPEASAPEASAPEASASEASAPEASAPEAQWLLDAQAEAALVAEAGPDAGNGPPSCAPGGFGMTDCGPDKESCCTSVLVPGGTFDRTFSYEDASFDGTDPATVSDVRIDKYEVTLGRYRQFLAAFAAGWTPPAGSGKHVHLNGGRGLEDDAMPGTYESGWDSDWLAPMGGLPVT